MVVIFHHLPLRQLTAMARSPEILADNLFFPEGPRWRDASMLPTGATNATAEGKLFYSDTFDFADMGPVLLQRLLKELQASTGFYEVQTGQTVGQVFITLLPQNFHWIQNTLARSLGVDVLPIDFPGWLKKLDLTPSSSVQVETLGTRWVGLFSLMGDYEEKIEG